MSIVRCSSGASGPRGVTGRAAGADAAAAQSARTVASAALRRQRAATKRGSMGRLFRRINAFILPAATPSARIPHRWFFPAAAAYAALALPVSVLAMLGMIPAPRAFSHPLGHAHEMLVGFALAVVAGYQLPQIARGRLALMFGLWIAGRVLFVTFPRSVAASLPDVAAALFDVLLHITLGVPVEAVVLALVLLLAALMSFMGGRILAPAVAGQFYRQGRNLDARVQPRIEGALLILIGAAIVTTPVAVLYPALRVACAAAGVVA